MNQVVPRQTKALNARRNPTMPVEYETAVKALTECLHIDEAKYWSDKADALAAWAKIYRSKDAERKAKQLKNHAFRRMDQLASELRPAGRGNKARGGPAPGPMSLLQEAGLSNQSAWAARRLGALSEGEFNKLNARKVIPSPVHYARTVSGPRHRSSPTWLKIRNAMGAFRTLCRSNDARSVADGITSKEVVKVRELVREVADWLDEFDRCLPKE